MQGIDRANNRSFPVSSQLNRSEVPTFLPRVEHSKIEVPTFPPPQGQKFCCKVPIKSPYSSTSAPPSPPLGEADDKCIIKHDDFQCQLFTLLSRRSAFLYGTKNDFQSSDLKMLQYRDYCLQKIVFVNKKTSFSVVMLHCPIFLDFKDLNFLPLISVSLPKSFTVQT